MFTKIKRVYNEYPNAFKVLTLSTFIDMLGSFILYPFYALYITEHFGVGMTQVGFLFTFFSAGNILGGVVGGALADRYGRRVMVLIGLVVSGIGSIFLGLVNDLYIFYILSAFLGLFGNIGFPARQAMVADLLPTEKQAEGFGILRVSFNISATIGPLLGGFLATKSFMLLFIADAVSSLITAIIVYMVIPETKPQKNDDEPEESVMKTIKGYKEVLKDWVFVLFLLVSAVTVLVYMQMNSTLSVFLWNVHGFSIQSFGLLLSMNAIIVVIFQLWITRKISKYNSMKMMAFGTFFYMIGFGMYGFVSFPYMFFIAMIIITVGEMIVTPVGQAAAASFAPEDKRGRYMAVFGFQWAIPNLFGVLGAGLIMENLGPNWVWYIAGILCLISIVGFWLLLSVIKVRFSKEIEE
ncbi:MAG: Multidrug resistance protein MdtH [Candidatus Lokiarchaeum sp. GC14_75]|nr:MAG: Multidrug resistance protein MdtH [Candidatus Lokiarchaeum sp. GC14_75]